MEFIVFRTHIRFRSARLASLCLKDSTGLVGFIRDESDSRDENDPNLPDVNLLGHFCLLRRWLAGAVSCGDFARFFKSPQAFRRSVETRPHRGSAVGCSRFRPWMIVWKAWPLSRRLSNAPDRLSPAAAQLIDQAPSTWVLRKYADACGRKRK